MLSEERLYKKKLVETLKVFDTICKENDIKYYACGGTAIGAVRHRGIIPWDDDIDVCMLKSDYNRFMNLKEKVNSTGYQIVDYHDDGYYLPFAKFVNCHTTLWEVPEHEFLIGVFIDIFPLYETVEDVDVNRAIREKYVKTFERYRHALSVQRISFNGLLFAIKGFHLGVLSNYVRAVLARRNRKRAKADFDKLVCELSKNGGNYVINFYTFYPVEKEILKKQWFENQVEFPFEETTIMLPNGYKEYLTQLFGDYMTPPPIEKQVTHHSHYFLDLNHRLTLAEIKSMKYGE